MNLKVKLPATAATKNGHRQHQVINTFFSTICVPLKPALDYKPRTLRSKIEEFPCLVHKLSLVLTALQYEKWGKKYIGRGL